MKRVPIAPQWFLHPFKLKAVFVLKAIEGLKTEGTEADSKVAGKLFEALI